MAIKRRYRFKAFLYWLSLPILFAAAWPGTAESQADRQLSLAMNVLNANSMRVGGLTAENILATIRGKPVTVKALTGNLTPRRIVMVLDASASIGDAGWNFVLWVVKEFVSSTPPNCSLSMIVFGSHIMQEISFSQDRQLILDELPRISRDAKSRGRGTNLYDAIHKAMDLLSPAGFGDAIYVISDGEDNHSKMSAEQLEDLILTQQTRLFLFRLDPSTQPGDSYSYSTSVRFMDNLCVDSGGMRLVCNAFWKSGQGSKPYKFDNAEKLDLSMQLKKFNATIFTFYRLDVELPSKVKRNAKLSLKLIGKQFSPSDNLRILYSPKIPIP